MEGAILVSRWNMLPMDKVDTEMADLEIAVAKTAGPGEKEAWGWLMERIGEFKRQSAKEKQA